MLLDTDVMVDFLRGYSPAVQWLTTCSTPVALPGLVAMELIAGCRNAVEQQRVERELSKFALRWPADADCNRAFHDFAVFHLSQSLGLLDALIAHTTIGLGEQLATFNVKHYSVVSGLQTIQPY